MIEAATLPQTMRVEELVIEAAETELIGRFGSLAEGEIRRKIHLDDSVVTLADESMERVLGQKLRQLIPSSRVVGEESVSAAPDLMRRLGGENPVWLIDPLDGTANFVRGDDRFGVLLAYVQGGRTLAGWIYLPMRGLMLSTTVGHGVRARAGGRLAFLPGPPPDPPLRGMAALHPVRGARSSGVFAKYLKRQGLNADITACTAHAYVQLLLGRIQFCLEAGEAKPWDHTAGVLAVQEAGGHVARLDGSPYRSDQPLGSLLAASSVDIWNEVAPAARSAAAATLAECA